MERRPAESGGGGGGLYIIQRLIAAADLNCGWQLSQPEIMPPRLLLLLRRFVSWRGEEKEAVAKL